MTEAHRVVAIVPTGDIEASEAFYKRLGFRLESDYGHYRILADGRGWHLHLNKVEGWTRRFEDNPFGLYLYVDDVDALPLLKSGDARDHPVDVRGDVAIGADARRDLQRHANIHILHLLRDAIDAG